MAIAEGAQAVRDDLQGLRSVHQRGRGRGREPRRGRRARVAAAKPRPNTVARTRSRSTSAQPAPPPLTAEQMERIEQNREEAERRRAVVREQNSMDMDAVRQAAVQEGMDGEPLELALGCCLTTRVGLIAAPGDRCTICLDEYATGQVTLRLPCMHVYHSACVVRWFSASYMQRRCPTCNINLGRLAAMGQ